GARVRWTTPFGTTKPCRWASSTLLSSRSIMKRPSRTKKNSSSLSCLCQWYSPCMTPRRTTESFTWHSVWLYQRSEHASTSEGTSTSCNGGNRTLRNVAEGYCWVTLMGVSTYHSQLLEHVISLYSIIVLFFLLL